MHGYDAQGRADAFGLSMAGDAAVRWLARFAHRAAGATAMALGNGIRFEQQADASGRPSSLRWLPGKIPVQPGLLTPKGG